MQRELTIRYHINQDGLDVMFELEDRIIAAIEPYGCKMVSAGTMVVGRWNRGFQVRGDGVELALAKITEIMKTARVEFGHEWRDIQEGS